MQLWPRSKTIFLSLFLVFSATFASAACNVNLSGNQFNRQINQGNINQSLFNAAILHYTNLARCQRGMRAYETAQDVFGAASAHGQNMASTRNYSHNSNVRRHRTLRERLQTQNTTFRAAGENIAKTFVFALNGRGFIQSGSCNFRYTANGQPIPIHTYNTLAQELVDSWKNSPGHRDNIYNRRFTRMGAGLGIVKNTPLCGELYAAQVFVR